RQAMEGSDSTGDEILRFLEEGAKQAVTLEKRIASALSKPSGIDYPRSPFGRHLEIIARLVATSDRGAVHFVQLTGFDTHAGQPESHPILLGVFAAAVAALIRDLKASRCFSNTALFVYSEFGRRVRENASLGTDHGKAGPAFVLGGGVDGGLKGAPPDLDELDEGDLKHTIDLRAIQAELAEGFLGFPAADDAVGRSGPALFKRR
ncbi:MAG: DUF1501 domain-containing protein, partial [Planctomycetes bacterium]|nr:DUF1501 domain-containing protein [Planctomycetota bacterium]